MTNLFRQTVRPLAFEMDPKGIIGGEVSAWEKREMEEEKRGRVLGVGACHCLVKSLLGYPGEKKKWGDGRRGDREGRGV